MPGTRKWTPIIMALAGLSQAGQVCNLVFDKCPGNFTSGTITVPPEVIWLDAKIPVCSENIQIQTGTDSPVPSIVFVIDNSSSMGTGRGGTDPDQSRFRVVKGMLDSIYKISPAAEVGLVIFTRRLAFDDRDNPFFKSAFPGDTVQHDSYAPLTPLNKDFGNGRLGLDTLKSLLSYTGSGNLTYATQTPDPRPNSQLTSATDMRAGTDITLGFLGAKEALKSAKAAKSDQYIIFLSDGEPGYVDDSRVPYINDFISGKDVPTTFTVFFTGGQSANAPATIRDMTDSIKARGFPNSAYWALNQPGVQLDTLLRNRVLNPIFTSTAGKAQKAVLTVSGNQYTSASVDGQSFNFSKRVPLSADQSTLNLVYTYSYVDSGKTKTKDVPYALTVRRGAAGQPLPAGISSACQEQGSIALYSKDTPVNLVTADHADLDVRLTLGAGETCNACQVEVKPSKSADREKVTLTPAASGAYHKGNFGRETAANPVPGNGKLEHLPADSIVVTYVNPENPLDVIRRAFPYSDVSTRLIMTRHNDFSRGGDGGQAQPDRQFILVAPAGLSLPASDRKNWSTVPAISTREDSLRYVGNFIQASRAFRVDIVIFSNLGQYVNKLSFTVPQSEFNKLPKGSSNGTRSIRVLWDNRAQNGRMAGTGAYIMKTTVTLLRIPGVAEDESSSSDERLVGVLHPAR